LLCLSNIYQLWMHVPYFQEQPVQKRSGFLRRKRRNIAWATALFDALREVIAHSRAQNGCFFGYVQGPGEPIAALGDFVASILTQNITAWRSSPAGVTIERTVVRWLAEAVGCHDFSGTLTGGGSAANLMGLAMARESRIPANHRGIYNAGAGVIYASEQVHMAVPKVVALLGIGCENLHYVPCDDSYRMVPSALERAIRTDEAQGRKPIAVVVSAGTVNTGSIDPLSEIALITRAHDLWLHVDGAYGALAAIAIPRSSTAWLRRIHFPSIRTNGCTSQSIVDVSCIATPELPEKRLTSQAVMRNRSALTLSKDSRSLRSRWNFHVALVR
jgi:glutamate/tyrosine decarboxylase-like PLP-dependent enzyme